MDLLAWGGAAESANHGRHGFRGRRACAGRFPGWRARCDPFGGRRCAVASPVSYPRGVTDSERMNDVAGAPVRINREICAVTFQGSISCMEVQTGQVLWEQPL